MIQYEFCTTLSRQNLLWNKEGNMKFTVVPFFDPLVLSEEENLSKSQPNSWLDSKNIFFSLGFGVLVFISKCLMWIIIMISNHNAEEAVW